MKEEIKGYMEGISNKKIFVFIRGKKYEITEMKEVDEE